MNIKITVLTMLLAAALITLFPPYKWGEERLQTEGERSQEIRWGFDFKPAREVLPLKERAFLFGATKHEFKIKDPSPNIDYESRITLDRKLAIEDLFPEYFLAALFGLLAGWALPKIRESNN